MFAADPVKFHLHSIAYANADHHPNGNYTLAYVIELTERGAAMWEGASPVVNASKLNTFEDGCYEVLLLDKTLETLRDDGPPGGEFWDDRYVSWRVSATVNSSKGDTDTDFMKDGVRAPNPEDDENEQEDNSEDEVDDEDEQEDNSEDEVDDEASAPSTPGLYPTNGGSTIEILGEVMVDTYPGEEDVSVNLVMPSDKGYSDITLYFYYTDTTGTRHCDQLDTILSSSSSIETELELEFDVPSDALGVCTFLVYIFPHPSASVQEGYTYSIKVYTS